MAAEHPDVVGPDPRRAPVRLRACCGRSGEGRPLHFAPSRLTAGRPLRAGGPAGRVSLRSDIAAGRPTRPRSRTGVCSLLAGGRGASKAPGEFRRS
ncbi:MAG: hypothetical protein ACODAA_06730, partial [Gemmatimonadota bacterium]